jgi:hypothetical protein
MGNAQSALVDEIPEIGSCEPATNVTMKLLTSSLPLLREMGKS